MIFSNRIPLKPAAYAIFMSLLMLGGVFLMGRLDLFNPGLTEARSTGVTGSAVRTGTDDPICGLPNGVSTADYREEDIQRVVATEYNQLWIPPTLTGTTFNLTLSRTSKQFLSGATTQTYGYNGSEFWGPTLIMNKGDRVQMNVTNHLLEETTTHWHGFHIPPATDGGPHQMIGVGSTWSPSFEVRNDAATYWYHPHLHEKTHEQLNYGAGGLIIIRDPQEAALALPRNYGVDDIPLVLTSRTFLTSNAILTSKIYGDNMVTNGTLNAAVSLPAQFVRFRILNAEIERWYNLGFSDNRTFYVIATDGGLVNAPVGVTRLVMAPGERYEILVDLSGDAVGSSIDMQSFNGGQTGGFGGSEPAQTGTFGSQLNNKTFNVLRINVSNRTSTGAITALPAKLAENTYWAETDATNSRTIRITEQGPGTPFTFDNVGYNMATINQTVGLDTVEKWTIANGRVFGHSFHIHDVQFRIVSRSSGPVPATEQGWKDTFSIRTNESVSFVARFDDFSSSTHPFMYHCHMSNHEDEGLMGQFLVLSNALASVASVSAASYGTGAVAAESIVAGFGANLATATGFGTSLPLPATLGGVSVAVTDALGIERLAPLFFVSPAQVNYQVPSGTALGDATVLIKNVATGQGSIAVAQGIVSVSGVAPGLFTANSSGGGVPAAFMLRVKADGTQSYETVARYDEGLKRYVPVEIDLGAATDKLYLIGFGTGFRNRSSLGAVTCTIGGTVADVLFAGSQDGYVGLDQANIVIPRSLAGRGNVDVVLRVDGVAANTVTINLK